MNKKTNYESVEVLKIKIHLQKIFPHARKIDVKVEKLATDEYSSFIHIFAPEKKELVVHKIDTSAKKSLEKAYHAMLKKIDRTKDRWDRMNGAGCDVVYWAS